MRSLGEQTGMAPKRKSEGKTDGGGMAGGEKPLPLRTEKAEKMRNPTARMGPGAGGDSNRASTQTGQAAKKGQTSNRGGKGGGKEKDSPPSHRGSKPSADAKGAAATAGKKPLSKIPEAAPTGPAGSVAGASGASPAPVVAKTAGHTAKKIEFFTDELM